MESFKNVTDKKINPNIDTNMLNISEDSEIKQEQILFDTALKGMSVSSQAPARMDWSGPLTQSVRKQKDATYWVSSTEEVTMMAKEGFTAIIADTTNRHQVLASMRRALEDFVFTEMTLPVKGKPSRTVYDMFGSSRSAKLDYVHTHRPVVTSQDVMRQERVWQAARESGNSLSFCFCALNDCSHAFGKGVIHSTDSVYYPGVLARQLQLLDKSRNPQGLITGCATHTVFQSSDIGSVATVICHIFDPQARSGIIAIGGVEYGAWSSMNHGIRMTVVGNPMHYGFANGHARAFTALYRAETIYIKVRGKLYYVQVVKSFHLSSSRYACVRINPSVDDEATATIYMAGLGYKLESDEFGNNIPLLDPEEDDEIPEEEPTISQMTSTYASSIISSVKEKVATMCSAVTEPEVLAPGRVYVKDKQGLTVDGCVIQGFRLHQCSNKLFGNNWSYGDYSVLDAANVIAEKPTNICDIAAFNTVVGKIMNSKETGLSTASSIVAGLHLSRQGGVEPVNSQWAPVIYEAAQKAAIYNLTHLSRVSTNQDSITLAKLKGGVYKEAKLVDTVKAGLSNLIGTKYSVGWEKNSTH